jgi:hypothetical protein
MAKIDDGFPTFIEFTEETIFGTLLWEKTVTPPGLQMGGANDTTTMRNTSYRTRAPKKLKTLSELSGSMAYDPECYTALEDMLGVNQLCRVHFPDGSNVEFWGWLDEFTPGEASEGEQPEADFTVIPSNQDASGVETAPVYNAPST